MILTMTEPILDFGLELEFGLIWIQPGIKKMARQSHPTS